jgi:eukaryotic-like serine/threonine-protein kinase
MAVDRKDVKGSRRMGATVDVTTNGRVTPKSLFGYEVLDFIGEGAGSQIYVVSDPNTRQLYALKHVVRHTEKDERFIEQLLAEYEVGKSVVHPGLRRSIDVKLNKTMLRKITEAALIMELFDGSPIEDNPPRRMLDVLDAFIQTGKALEALHKAGYVHCDLKPNNILLNNAGEVKVIDLGQACKMSTVKSRIQGTPDFIAPEQVKCEAVTAKTDVYNLGATMYWVLTGKHIPTLYTIKRGENSFLVDAAVETPKDLNPKCPETLSNMVMDCVKVVPGKRPEMADLIRRLEVIQYAIQRGSAAPVARLAAAV